MKPHTDVDDSVLLQRMSAGDEDAMTALYRRRQGGIYRFALQMCGSRALAEIIRAVASGEGYVSPALSARMLSDLSSISNASNKTDLISELSSREYEVLDLAAAGLSNKRIALKLDIHEKTVKHHMGRIFAKLNVTNRTEAAMALRDAGHDIRLG